MRSLFVRSAGSSLLCGHRGTHRRWDGSLALPPTSERAPDLVDQGGVGVGPQQQQHGFNVSAHGGGVKGRGAVLDTTDTYAHVNTANTVFDVNTFAALRLGTCLLPDVCIPTSVNRKREPADAGIKPDIKKLEIGEAAILAHRLVRLRKHRLHAERADTTLRSRYEDVNTPRP